MTEPSKSSIDRPSRRFFKSNSGYGRSSRKSTFSNSFKMRVVVVVVK